MEVAKKIEFEDIKPFCCEVMKSPTRENLKKLLDIVKPLPASSFTPEIANYIIFPLVVHLKVAQKLKPRAKILLFLCMEQVLLKSDLENNQIFFEVFQNFNMVLGFKSNQPTMELCHDLPEEILLAIGNGLVQLLRSISSQRRDLLFGEKYVASVGHCIYMHLQVVNSDFTLDIRLKSLEIVELIFKICKVKEELCKKAFSFIPGVVSALLKSASPRVGRVRKGLVTKSIEVLATAVTVALSFESNPETLEQVDRNLLTVFETLSRDLACSDEEAFRVRMAISSMEILSALKEKLPKSCEILEENVSIGCWDPSNLGIQQLSRNFLKQTISSESGSTLEKSFKLLKKANGLLISNNDKDCTRVLKLVASNLLVSNLLFCEISALLPHLAKLFTFAILTNNYRVDPGSSGFTKPTDFERICNDLCQVLSEACNFGDVFEEVLPFLNLMPSLNFEDRLDTNFPGTLLLFSRLCDHFPEDEVQPWDLDSVAEIYIQVLDRNTKEREGTTPKVLSVLDVECALLIEGLGILARVDSYRILPLVLYYFCEFAGNESEVVLRAAKRQLTLIAAKFQSPADAMEEDSTALVEYSSSVLNFLTTNIDLIMSELAVRASSISSHPHCPNALLFLSKFFDFRESVFVSFIQDIFVRSCDQFYSTSQVPFSKIFYAFILSLWSQSKSLAPPEVTPTSRLSLRDRILNYQKSIGIDVEDIPLEDDKNEDETPTEGEKMDEEDQEKKLAPELKLVLNICERVLNFIPKGNERTVQIISMDCLIYGVQLLKDSENSLLPLAHTIWQNLLSRFTDNDLTVIRKSFELLLVMCKSSGSFMKKRVVEEVFPKLSSILMTLAKESERFSQRSTLYYVQTQAYQLQMVILEGLADLCLSLDLNEEELDRVVEGCLLYLRPEQHKNLREAAMKLVDVFANSEHAPVIWMKLCTQGVRQLPKENSPVGFTPLPEL